MQPRRVRKPHRYYRGISTVQFFFFLFFRYSNLKIARRRGKSGTREHANIKNSSEDRGHVLSHWLGQKNLVNNWKSTWTQKIEERIHRRGKWEGMLTFCFRDRSLGHAPPNFLSIDSNLIQRYISETRTIEFTLCRSKIKFRWKGCLRYKRANQTWISFVCFADCTRDSVCILCELFFVTFKLSRRGGEEASETLKQVAISRKFKN